VTGAAGPARPDKRRALVNTVPLNRRRADRAVAEVPTTRVSRGEDIDDVRQAALA
jgi:hypothetical protein